ncbi:MAG: hypothetical protein JXM68_14815 [Sedimentisphaerales bacterium]|nr:hypothetical protein [Sedimentisphaerales bacterium]
MYLIELKQVKQAIESGDLACAARLLGDEYLRSHKDGAALVGKLVDALVDRAQAAVDAGDLAAAGSDIALAIGLSAGNSRAVALNAQISQLKAQEEHARSMQRDNIARAGEFMAKGQLTVSLEVLNGAEKTPAGELLRQQAHQHRLERENIAAHLQQAISAHDIDHCLVITARLSASELNASEYAELLRQLRQMIAARLKADFTAGKLTGFALLFERSAHIIGQMVDFAHWQDVLARYRKASVLLARHDYRGAMAQLKPVTSAVADCQWLDLALQSLTQMAALQDELSCLLPEIQLISPFPAGCEHEIPVVKAKPADNIAGKPLGKTVRTLNIDGVGSYLLFLSDKISLGPVSSSRPCDIAVVAAANMPGIDLYRQEGDYFACCQNGSIEVNGRSRKEHLLAHADKIAISRQGSVKYLRANPASNTAVFDLKSLRLPNSDISAAIMAEGEVILGPGSGAHIRCRNLDSDLILKLDKAGNISYEGVAIIPGELFTQKGISMMIE